MSFRATTSNVQRQASNALRSARNERYNCIQVRGLPKTTLPQDVWRMIRHAGVENVVDIRLDYFNFIPAGRAFLRLSDSRFTDSVLPIVKRCTFATSRIYANPCEVPSEVSTRTRGKKGREEAVERGVLEGNGPAAGVHVQGCDVVVSGLPYGTTPEVLARYLKRIKLVGESNAGMADCEVLRAKTLSGGINKQRYLIRLKTAAEAHAIVRRLHMTYCRPWTDGAGNSSLVQARVLY